MVVGGSSAGGGVTPVRGSAADAGGGRCGVRKSRDPCAKANSVSSDVSGRVDIALMGEDQCLNTIGFLLYCIAINMTGYLDLLRVHVDGSVISGESLASRLTAVVSSARVFLLRQISLL